MREPTTPFAAACPVRGWWWRPGGYTSSVFGTEDGRRRLVVSLTIATADEMRPARQLLDIVRSVFPES